MNDDINGGIEGSPAPAAVAAAVPAKAGKRSAKVAAQPKVEKAVAPTRITMAEMAEAARARGSICAARPNDGETVDITLSDTDEMGPTGQFFGVNGRGFVLLPNVRYTVPKYLLECIDHAVTGKPVVARDGSLQGFRQVTRFPYTTHAT